MLVRLGLKDTIDPLLEPILSRNGARKGRFIRIGERLVEYDEKFKLYLHTKLANPHYKPEIVARIHVIQNHLCGFFFFDLQRNYYC
jgi:dynein heavy chain